MNTAQAPSPGVRRPPAWMSPNVEGALWMACSAVTFTIMTILVHYLGTQYSATLQTFYRQAASLAVLTPMLIRSGPRVFHATRPGILIFRAGAGTLAVILANYGYQLLPLAVANALSFTRALWIAPLAATFLHERVDRVRIGASVVGFAGVLIILGADIRQPAAFWPALAGLASAFLFAFTVTGGKFVTRDHSVLTILAWGAVLGFVFSIPPALLSWRTPTLRDFVLLCLMGASGMVTQACFVKGIQRGDATATAPVDYIRLVFAIAAGYFLFGEVPRWSSLGGAAVVIGSAIYLAWREHGIAVRAARAAAAESAG
jgi:drug/metabolite transporter (DMT)-like permease